MGPLRCPLRERPHPPWSGGAPGPAAGAAAPGGERGGAMAGSGSRVQRIGGPAVFVLLWSTGFVGAKYGLPYAPPFAFLGLRLGIAAALLALIALVLRSARPAPAAQYGHAAVVGVLLHAGYLGGVFYAISVGVPAGVSAVVVSLQPVL